MRPVRLELTAPRLKGGCSTTELRALKTVKKLSGFNRIGLNPTKILYQKNFSHARFFYFSQRLLFLYIYYNSFFFTVSIFFGLTSSSRLYTI